MVEAWVASTLVALVSAGVALGAWGRLGRFNAIAVDVRLARLARFYALMGAALFVQVLQAVRFERSPMTGDGFEVLDVLFWVHHALMIGALWHAATAASAHPPRPVLVLAPLLLAAEPVLRLVEAAGFFLLLTRGSRTHLRRSNVRSLETTVGLFLLFAGHAVFLINRFQGAAPLGARDLWGELLVLVGFVVLWATTPRRRGPPA